MRITDIFLRSLFRRWGFLLQPDEVLDDEQVAAFERVWRSISSGGGLKYDLPYAKTTFTRWLTGEKGVLLHGSNRQNVAGFPRSEHFLLTWARYGQRIEKQACFRGILHF